MACCSRINARVMLQAMLCPSMLQSTHPVQTVCDGAPVMAHNMITTIMNTAA